MPWGGWDLSAGLARERVAHAATALLMIRVLEGLAAWLLFNEFFLGSAPVTWWAVPASFILFLTLNLVVTLYYRRGRLSTPLLILDVLTNVVPLTLPLAASGGLASPLLLLFPVKAIIYVTLFNARVASLSLFASIGMLALVVALGRADLVPVVRLYEVPSVAVYSAVRLALLCQLAIAPLAVAWLRHVVAAAEREAQNARLERQEKDSAALAAANAVLAASETLGPLTRVDEVLEQSALLARRILATDECALALWFEGGQYQLVRPGEDARPRVPAPEDVKDFEWVRRLGHCVVVPPSEASETADAHPALLLAPLLNGERFTGVLCLTRWDPRRVFTQRDLLLAAGLARQSAIALERVRSIEEYERLSQALESTEEVIAITDVRRRILFANSAFLRTFGYERHEVLGRDALELASPGPEWIDAAQREVSRGGWRAEVTGRRKDGVTMPLRINCNAIRGDDGRIIGVVAFVQDVSAEKSFHEQLQRADRLAAVGEIAAGIAHEINNALAAIFGQLEGVDRLEAPELRAALKRIDRQAHRIADIVQGIVGFARPRPPHREPVDLGAVTRETLELLRRDLQPVELETDFDAELPPALADRQQVQQVLLNLLNNALQAMAGRSPMRLRVTVAGADDRLAIRVTDNGSGIPPEVLPRVFDPFFSTKPEGTGLGLSVSYAIARAHGGDLVAESVPGAGTTFSLYLPIAPRPAREAARTALVVDDDADVGQALAEMLSREGFVVDRASTAAEALAMVDHKPWDVILLDVRLPDLSGPEIFAELARTRADLAERVVFVTGGIWRSESRLREELPAQPVLAKPCTQNQLRATLRQLRSRPRAAA